MCFDCLSPSTPSQLQRHLLSTRAGTALSHLVTGGGEIKNLPPDRSDVTKGIKHGEEVQPLPRHPEQKCALQDQAEVPASVPQPQPGPPRNLPPESPPAPPSSHSSYPCISVKSNREKEVGDPERPSLGGQGQRQWGGGGGCLTSREQRIPATKHAMKPLILVFQLSEDVSATCSLKNRSHTAPETKDARS